MFVPALGVRSPKIFGMSKIKSVESISPDKFLTSAAILSSICSDEALGNCFLSASLAPSTLFKNSPSILSLPSKASIIFCN